MVVVASGCRHKFDHFMSELTQGSDFRNNVDDIKAEHVLQSIALTLEWFRDRPECIVAATESGALPACTHGS